MMNMKTITKIVVLLSLTLVMVACQEQEPAYKSKLDIKTESYDLDFTVMKRCFSTWIPPISKRS